MPRDLAIQRRTILAPFDGEVVTIYRHQDEWVSPGDAILRLVRLDTMLVEGRVEQSAYDPHEVQRLRRDGRGRTWPADARNNSPAGSPTSARWCGSTAAYIVRAEVANRQEHGHWLLRDGMTATMTIHLSTAGAGALDVSRTP